MFIVSTCCNTRKEVIDIFFKFCNPIHHCLFPLLSEFVKLLNGLFFLVSFFLRIAEITMTIAVRTGCVSQGVGKIDILKILSFGFYCLIGWTFFRSCQSSKKFLNFFDHKSFFDYLILVTGQIVHTRRILLLISRFVDFCIVFLR